MTGVRLTGIKLNPGAFTDKYTQFNDRHSVMKTCVPIKKKIKLIFSYPALIELRQVYNFQISRIHNNQGDT